MQQSHLAAGRDLKQLSWHSAEDAGFGIRLKGIRINRAAHFPLGGLAKRNTATITVPQGFLAF